MARWRQPRRHRDPDGGHPAFADATRAGDRRYGQRFYTWLEAGGGAEMKYVTVAGSILPAAATIICRPSPSASSCHSAVTPPPWPICLSGAFSVLSVGAAKGSACWTGGRSSAVTARSGRLYRWNHCCGVSVARTARKTALFSLGRKEIGHDEVCQTFTHAAGCCL